jgi:hypothetical protein
MAVTADYNVITHTNMVVIGRVYRDGTTLYISNIGAYMANASLRDMYRVRALRRVERASGAVISCPADRNIALTAALLFSNYSKITTLAFDSSGADRWITWYRDGIGRFNKILSEYSVNNTQYDDGSGTLAALTGNYYANRWFYLVPTDTGSQVHMLMGQSQYNKQADAEAASPPTVIPTLISELAILVGRVVVKEGIATLIIVQSAFTTEFSTATPSVHNELSGLQGGTADQYYHATSAEKAWLAIEAEKNRKVLVYLGL